MTEKNYKIDEKKCENLQNQEFKIAKTIKKLKNARKYPKKMVKNNKSYKNDRKKYKLIKKCENLQKPRVQNSKTM